MALSRDFSNPSRRIHWKGSREDLSPDYWRIPGRPSFLRDWWIGGEIKPISSVRVGQDLRQSSLHGYHPYDLYAIQGLTGLLPAADRIPLSASLSRMSRII